MRIQHNIMAMNAYRNYNNNTSALSKNLEKLSSGYKINRAGDDAAGLAISEKMRAQITGLNAAQKNVKDGISLVKTGEGAMQEIQDMLNRMDYLATQSANGTYDNEVDRANLQKEVDSLKSEINRIADSANFNGIKLLDGSLATTGAAGADSIKVAGNINAEYSTSKAGKYDAAKFALDTNMTNWKGTGTLGEGDTFEYGVHLADGTGYTARVTAKKDSEGNFYLEGDSGAKYTLATNAPTKVKVSVGELDTALKGELQKTSLSDKYVIATDGAGAFTFTAKEDGSATPAVLAVDYASTDASDAANNRVTGKAIGVTVVDQARDVGYEIKADDIIEYNGKNYENAVFTINGKKFVLLTDQMDGSTSTTEAAKNKPENATKADEEYLRAVQALGKDVTVLVGGHEGLKNVAAPNGNQDNFKQNIAKIAEVTGLNVTDAIAGDDNNIGVGEGIRLSAGKGTLSGGLTLQIGDTADSFNQMRVSIGDMHTKAMGIDGIDISNQQGASAAIETIKSAINYVSGIRGDLGAVQNRLEHTQNNLSVMAENIQDAESTIRDTDVAEEMMSYVKNNILVQSAQAMLAQANQVPQGVLQLLG